MRRSGLLAATVAVLLAAAPASAGDRLFATTDQSSPRVVSFDSGSPGTYLTDKAITGLGVGESILGLDSRPRGGAIYVITSADKLYTVDPATGALALVATLAPAGGDDNPFTALGPHKSSLTVIVQVPFGFSPRNAPSASSGASGEAVTPAE